LKVENRLTRDDPIYNPRSA